MQGIEAQLPGMCDDSEPRRSILGLDKAGRKALVVLRRDAVHTDILEAYVQAFLLLHFTGPLVSPCLFIHPKMLVS
jgi:hypothetical protein